MNQVATIPQDTPPTRRDAIQVVNTVPILDTSRFEHMQRIAVSIARSNLVPETLRTVGAFKDKQDLPFEVVMANVFLVVNQAVRWGMDPFAVLSCTAVVHGRLCYEGKLVAAVLESKLGVELDPVWNDKSGDAFGITLRGVLPSGKVREVSGTVGEWKTTGNNSPWGNPRRQLLYRGIREWARWWAPSILLGVYTDDELADLQDNARAQRAMPVPSQQEQMALIASQPKAEPAKRRTPPEPPADEPVHKKAEPTKTSSAPQKVDRELLASDAAMIPDPDWTAELQAYDNRVSACEAEETLVEVIESYGGMFDDAPAEVQAEARKLEAAQRQSIERQA